MPVAKRTNGPTPIRRPQVQRNNSDSDIFLLRANIAAPDYRRPDFEWSPEALKEAKSLIEAHDRNGTHKPTKENIDDEVKAILNICRSKYYIHCRVWDTPENNQAQFEAMCLYGFSSEIFFHRNDDGTGGRVGVLFSSFILHEGCLVLRG